MLSSLYSFFIPEDAEGKILAFYIRGKLKCWLTVLASPRENAGQSIWHLTASRLLFTVYLPLSLLCVIAGLPASGTCIIAEYTPLTRNLWTLTTNAWQGTQCSGSAASYGPGWISLTSVETFPLGFGEGWIHAGRKCPPCWGELKSLQSSDFAEVLVFICGIL